MRCSGLDRTLDVSNSPHRLPQSAGLAAAAALAVLAVVTPARAENPFSGLRSVEAEGLSPAQMQATTGQSGASVAAALTTAASQQSNATAAATFNSLAAAYAKITVPTSRLVINRVVVRR
jgi:hypothetical protein